MPKHTLNDCLEKNTLFKLLDLLFSLALNLHTENCIGAEMFLFFFQKLSMFHSTNFKEVFSGNKSLHALEYKMITNISLDMFQFHYWFSIDLC